MSSGLVKSMHTINSVLHDCLLRGEPIAESVEGVCRKPVPMSLGKTSTQSAERITVEKSPEEITVENPVGEITCERSQ
jgi:hypothetical protein